ncbi:MAG: hypothetical protein AVDCRST_MAG64-2189, partial [uncultured Phycisphaerae bacterium]
EVVCLVFRQHGSVRAAARWMVVFGALGGLPAACAGAYALSDVARRTAPAELPDDAPWHAVTSASSLNADQWEMLESHAWTSGGIAVIAAVLVTLAVACSDRWRAGLYPVFLGMLLGCAGFMSVGAWYGGEMVYRHGVAVRLPYAEVEGERPDGPAVPSSQPAAARAAETAEGAGASLDSPAAETQREKPRGVEYFVNPLQAHVTLAGLAAALGMLGIGLSLRAASTSPHWRDPELSRAGVEALPHPQRGGREDLALLRSFAPNVEVTGEVERIPVARFWLVTFLVSAAASLAGWWVLGGEHETYDPQQLWRLVTGEGYVRRLAHVVGAGAVVVLPLFLALLGRVARRSRVMIGLFAMLLVVAVAAQVWLGVLLMYDQPHVPRGTGAWYLIRGGAETTGVVRTE